MKKRIFKPMNLLLILGVCYLGYILVSQQIIINRIQGQINEADQENKKIEESNEYLNDKIKYALIKPGEIIYILHDENASNDNGK